MANSKSARPKKGKAIRDQPAGSKAAVKGAPPGTPAAAGKLTPWEDDMDRLFDDFLRRRWGRLQRGDWPSPPELPAMLEARTPSLDIVDHDTEIIVRAEVPGIDKKDLDLSVVDRTLTIRGSSRQEKEEAKDDYYRQEIRSGTFSRSVLLPAEVDGSKAKASYADGVVELRLPKVSGSRRQKITVG